MSCTRHRCKRHTERSPGLSDEVQIFGITPPINSSVFSIDDHQLPLCTVDRILITWPPGCAGLVQVKIFAGGNFAYPSVDKQAFGFDDYTLDIPVSNPINSGQWQAWVTNTDSIENTIHVTYF